MLKRRTVCVKAISDLLALTRSFASTSTVVSAEVAQRVSLRSSRMMYLPGDLQSAIETAISDFDVSRKDVKLKSKELASRLKHLSRTKHRGGVNPNLGDRTPRDVGYPTRAPRGKHRQADQHNLLTLTRTAALPVMNQGPPDLDGWLDDHTMVPRPPAPKSQDELYNHLTAAAYAASRMPACYAALHRALSEVHRARPGWRPTAVLDYGSGPGTATWAVREVWRGGSAIDVLAIEPVAYMAALAQEVARTLDTQERERIAAAAGVSKEKQTQLGDGLAAMNSSTSSSSSISDESYQDEDSYNNNEDEEEVLPPPVMNMRWSHKLYKAQARGPGSKGFDIVVAGYVLAEIDDEKERRRLIDELWSRTSPNGLLVLVEPGTPSGSARILAARSQILSSSSSAAHVVAPCPHDGTCPLTQRQAWCHFVQRFERPPMQREMKKGPSGSGARTYQDERFSYVVLARGARYQQGVDLDAGTPGTFVDVSGVAPVEETEVTAEEYLYIPKDLKPKRIILKNMMVDESDADFEDLPADMLEMLKEHNASLSTNTQGSGPSSSDQHVMTLDNQQQQDGADIDELTRSLILQSLGQEDSDDDENENHVAQDEEELDPTLLEELDAAIKETLAKQQTSVRQTQLLANKAALDHQEYTKQLAAVTEYGANGSEAEAAAILASKSWSRVIRMPRKRSGHVVLDICSGMTEQGRPAPQGTLLRQIVSKSASRNSTGGAAAYKLARRLMWGDVWPMGYQRRIKAMEAPALQDGTLAEP